MPLESTSGICRRSACVRSNASLTQKFSTVSVIGVGCPKTSTMTDTPGLTALTLPCAPAVSDAGNVRVDTTVAPTQTTTGFGPPEPGGSGTWPSDWLIPMD